MSNVLIDIVDNVHAFVHHSDPSLIESLSIKAILENAIATMAASLIGIPGGLWLSGMKARNKLRGEHTEIIRSLKNEVTTNITAILNQIDPLFEDMAPNPVVLSASIIQYIQSRPDILALSGLEVRRAIFDYGKQVAVVEKLNNALVNSLSSGAVRASDSPIVSVISDHIRSETKNLARSAKVLVDILGES